MRRADLVLIAIVLIWGSTFVVVKQALNDVSTLLFLALRFVLATIALALIFRPRRAALARALKPGVLAGVALFLGYFFQTTGLRYTTPSKSGFITGLSVVIVPLLSALTHGRGPGRIELAGVAAAAAGLTLMTIDLQSLSVSYGDLMTVACAFAYAGHIILVGRYASKIDTGAFTFIQIATAAVLAAASFWVQPVFVRWTPGLIGAIVLTGLLATALAFAVQTWAQRHTTATRTALIFSLEPVFAAATSYLVLGEILRVQGAIGAALILAGILLVELRRPGSAGA